MESLKKILHDRQTRSIDPQEIERIKVYVQRKHGFSPKISLTPKIITLYAPTSAQASLLRLDWANLKQMAGVYKISIRLKRTA